MRNFIREKQIFCSNEYKEIDIIPYTGNQIYAVNGKRGKRTKESEPKQKNLNDENAKRYYIQIANANFFRKDQHVTVTYDKNNLPATVEEAEKIVKKYINRIIYARKQKGLSPLKYMLVTSCGTDNEEKPIRIHHHIIINAGLDRDEIEDLWCERKKKGEEKGKKIGYANCDRLQLNESGIAALANYMVKQGKGKKKWSSSRNLKKPTSARNDTKYTKREIEKIVINNLHDIAFWEKKYKGWTITDSDYGIKSRYNEITGWSIYLKLRKK